MICIHIMTCHYTQGFRLHAAILQLLPGYCDATDPGACTANRLALQPVLEEITKAHILIKSLQI